MQRKHLVKILSTMRDLKRAIDADVRASTEFDALDKALSDALGFDLKEGESVFESRTPSPPISEENQRLFDELTGRLALDNIVAMSGRFQGNDAVYVTTVDKDKGDYVLRPIALLLSSSFIDVFGDDMEDSDGTPLRHEVDDR